MAALRRPPRKWLVWEKSGPAGWIGWDGSALVAGKHGRCYVVFKVGTPSIPGVRPSWHTVNSQGASNENAPTWKVMYQGIRGKVVNIGAFHTLVQAKHHAEWHFRSGRHRKHDK